MLPTTRSAQGLQVGLFPYQNAAIVSSWAFSPSFKLPAQLFAFSSVTGGSLSSQTTQRPLPSVFGNGNLLPLGAHHEMNPSLVGMSGYPPELLYSLARWPAHSMPTADGLHFAGKSLHLSGKFKIQLDSKSSKFN